jgi:DNA-binding MarR family transcriptional regulator
MSAELATVSLRTEFGVAEAHSWTAVDSTVLSTTVPWRTFRWYKGQRHYSGVYWSVTMHDHIVYESRLELLRLIFADFDRSVHRILAQPFLLKAKALTSPYAWQRLNRFAAATGYRTLREAAGHLGITQTTLAVHINRLERDIGGPLLQRAKGGRPMSPTPLGEQVIAALHRTSRPTR